VVGDWFSFNRPTSEVEASLDRAVRSTLVEIFVLCVYPPLSQAAVDILTGVVVVLGFSWLQIVKLDVGIISALKLVFALLFGKFLHGSLISLALTGP
jgi:hypothetical protein